MSDYSVKLIQGTLPADSSGASYSLFPLHSSLQLLFLWFQQPISMGTTFFDLIFQNVAEPLVLLKSQDSSGNSRPDSSLTCLPLIYISVIFFHARSDFVTIMTTNSSQDFKFIYIFLIHWLLLTLCSFLSVFSLDECENCYLTLYIYCKFCTVFINNLKFIFGLHNKTTFTRCRASMSYETSCNCQYFCIICTLRPGHICEFFTQHCRDGNMYPGAKRWTIFIN